MIYRESNTKENNAKGLGIRKKGQLQTEDLYEIVLQKLDMTREIEDEELLEIIKLTLDEVSSEAYISLSQKIRISKDLFNAFKKLDVLQEILEDESITEIMINGTNNIYLEKEGRIIETDKRFVSIHKLEDVIQQIVAGTNRYVNQASPIVDTRLKDGSRVNVVLKPVAVNGPIMTIRKFPFEKVTMDKLIDWGSINAEAAKLIETLVKAKYNIFVCGGTGSGKTTFLNAISDYIPEDERVITIEDNAELQLRVSNLVQLEARNANLEGEGAVAIRELIRAALRQRPDRILVGEVRGEETVDMISSAMLNGHNGSMSTGHANSVTDMLYRLETMMMMGIDLPLPAISRQIASALDVIIHLGRLRDKSRKVLEIAEVLGYEDGKIKTQTIYSFEEEGIKDEKINGTLVKREELVFREKLLAAGYK